MKSVCTVQPFLAERSLKVTRITKRPPPTVPSFSFLGTRWWPSSASRRTRCSSKPRTVALQNKDRTPNLGLLQEIRDTRSSAVRSLLLVLPLASTCPAAATRTTAAERLLAAQSQSQEDMASRCRPQTPVQEPTPSEAPAGATEPSSSNFTGPSPPPEYMATSWRKTWRTLFHWWCATPTKQAPPGTNLILLSSTKQEKKKTPRPPSPKQ